MSSDVAWQVGAGARGDDEREPMPSDEEEALLTQIGNMRRDADRLRLLRNAAFSYTLSCDFIKRAVAPIEFTEGRVDACVLLHAAARDSDAFESTVLMALRFEDERNQVRQKLSQAQNTPAVPAAAPPPVRAPSAPKATASWIKKPTGSDEDSD
jgi:hypothetical protein